MREDRPTKGPQRRIRRRKHTLLLVEDDETTLLLLGRYLRRAGYRVLVASTESAALDLSDAFPGRIDAVVVSFRMRRGGGPAVARKLRSSRPSTPILYMSAFAHVRMCTEYGLDLSQILLKPVDPEELERLIKALIGENRPLGRARA